MAYKIENFIDGEVVKTAKRLSFSLHACWTECPTYGHLDLWTYDLDCYPASTCRHTV